VHPKPLVKPCFRGTCMLFIDKVWRAFSLFNIHFLNLFKQFLLRTLCILQPLCSIYQGCANFSDQMAKIRTVRIVRSYLSFIYVERLCWCMKYANHFPENRRLVFWPDNTKGMLACLKSSLHTAWTCLKRWESNNTAVLELWYSLYSQSLLFWVWVITRHSLLGLFEMHHESAFVI
jgi:hypothetical protein